jgi:hypothetical protein
MRLAFALLLATTLLMPAPDPRAWTLDDFEDGDLLASHGLGWVGLGDDLIGGASTIELNALPAGAHESRHALGLRGRVADAPNAFTGAWVPLEGRGRPVDLSAFQAVRFRARGEGSFQAGIRQGAMAATANFMAPFAATAEWKTVEIAFASFAPSGMASKDARWSPKECHWLGITSAPDAHGAFRLEVDDVELVAKDGAVAAAPVASDGPPRTVRTRPSPAPSGGTWRELARDAAGDGRRPSLPDAVALSVLDGPKNGPLWFRIALKDPLPTPWIGVNLALDTDGNADDGMPWWGTNTSFNFDRLVTVWVFHGPAGDQGVVGVADARHVGNGELIDEGGEAPLWAVDPEGPAVLVGVPRAALGPAGVKTRVVAAVGSALLHNDDVPDAGAAEVSP